jgi:hypothetical protein
MYDPGLRIHTRFFFESLEPEVEIAETLRRNVDPVVEQLLPQGRESSKSRQIFEYPADTDPRLEDTELRL